MAADQIIFFIISVITLASALVVVTDRNLFHAALAMMLSFLGVAGYYALLGSGFMAASQLLVYIGAISILVIFAIMMTRKLMTTNEAPFNRQWGAALVGSLMVFALLSFAIFNLAELPITVFSNTAPTVTDAVLEGQVVELGYALTSKDGFVLSFELASVLLLAALVGAIVIARTEWDGDVE